MPIRPAVEADLPAMLAIYAPYVENTTHSFEYDVPCLRTFTQRFFDHIAQFPWLVWEEDGEILGYAYAGLPFERPGYRWDAEASIYVRSDVHGKGIGRALYARLEEILTKQGYRTLYSIITGENTGSLEFHYKAGYHHLATFPNCGFKHGRWLDVVWLQKELNPFTNPAGFPKKWTDVM